MAEEAMDRAGAVDEEEMVRDLEAMLDSFDLSRLQEIDRSLRRLPDTQVTREHLEQMFKVMLVWLRSGRGREGFPIALKAVRCARILNDVSLLRKMLTARGVLASTTLDVGIGIECHLEAMQLSETLNDVVLKGNSLLNLGLACSYISLDVVALKCFQQALNIARDLQAEKGVPRVLECISLCALASVQIGLRDYRAALRAAQECQSVGRRALPDLQPSQKVQTEDSIAISQCNEVSALVRLGMHEEARSIANKLDSGSAATNIRAGQARIARAELAAATGDVKFAIEELRNVATDPVYRHHRRGALASLVECYELAGSPAAALLAMQELQAEVEAARREVALEELRRIDGIDPAQDEEFDRATRRRLASYRVAIDDIGARLTLKLHYLNELAVSAEIREGNEEDRAEHIYRVGALCSLLAAEAGCSEELCWLAEVAGRLHDIGKSSIPDAIVLKGRSLSEGEWSMVQVHSSHGAQLITDAAEPQLVQVVAAVRHHHERFDGGGYPGDLKAEAIPLLARIVAVSESFDAMLQSRTYRSSRSVLAALEEIERCAGNQFDPRLAGLFIQMVRRIQREVGDLREYLGQHGRSSSAVGTFSKLSSLFNTPAMPFHEANGK